MSKLAHSNQETMDQIERDADKYPDEGFLFHSTPKPDACDHSFKGWRDRHDDEGNVCGGEQVCAKCGMGAMTYTLRMGF